MQVVSALALMREMGSLRIIIIILFDSKLQNIGVL